MSITQEEMKKMSTAELEAAIAERLPYHEKRKNVEKKRFLRKRKKNNKFVSDKERSEMAADLKRCGFKEEYIEYNAIDRDLAKIIRADCNGFVNNADKRFMSDEFKEAIEKPAKFNVHSNQYNLNKIDCWKYMKQFNELRTLGPAIQKSLARRKINPKYLMKMNFEDIVYLLGDNKDKIHNGGDHFYIIKESAKVRMVKKTVNEQGREFFEILKKKYNGNENKAKVAFIKAQKYGKLPYDQDLKLEAHHIFPVSNALKLDDVSKINSPDSLVILDKPIHDCMHQVCDHDHSDMRNKDKIRFFTINGYSVVCGERDEFKMKRINESRPRKQGKLINLKDRKPDESVRYSQRVIADRRAYGY